LRQLFVDIIYHANNKKKSLKAITISTGFTPVFFIPKITPITISSSFDHLNL